MTNGVFEVGEWVITKDGEGVVNKSQHKIEDHIEVKLDIGEVKNYPQAEISDDYNAR